MKTPCRGDRGSATIFAAAISLVLVMAATVAVVVVAVVLASHTARSAADLAALAAATAEVGGSDACAAARVNARANGAEVTSCQVAGETSSFVVAVTLTVRTGLRAPLPEQVGGEAHAGNVAG
jgi:secretion/DNA translocation related TadE-like protein